MRKTLLFGVKPVVELSNFGGFVMGVVPAVEFTADWVVDKLRGLCALITSFLRVVIHGLFAFFVPVKPSVLPTFHTTYYKLQLIKLSSC